MIYDSDHSTVKSPSSILLEVALVLPPWTIFSTILFVSSTAPPFLLAARYFLKRGIPLHKILLPVVCGFVLNELLSGLSMPIQESDTFVQYRGIYTMWLSNRKYGFISLRAAVIIRSEIGKVVVDVMEGFTFSIRLFNNKFVRFSLYSELALTQFANTLSIHQVFQHYGQYNVTGTIMLSTLKY